LSLFDGSNVESWEGVGQIENAAVSRNPFFVSETAYIVSEKTAESLL
jgi:hypothetical protein